MPSLQAQGGGPRAKHGPLPLVFLMFSALPLASLELLRKGSNGLSPPQEGLLDPATILANSGLRRRGCFLI